MEQIKRTIENVLNTTLIGYAGSEAKVVSSSEIIRIYAEKDRVLMECENGILLAKEKLYELEKKLDGEKFVRISRAEIVNLRKIIRLDTSITGTIKVYLQGNAVTYVSRRNVARIKSVLGI